MLIEKLRDTTSPRPTVVDSDASVHVTALSLSKHGIESGAPGADFNHVVRKGYVPTLMLEDAEIPTENIAVLDWLAARHPAFGVPGSLGRPRVL